LVAHLPDSLPSWRRVVPNGADSAVIFTLVRAPGVTDAKLAEDRRAVERDLATLERLLQPAP
jgi:hypothetical protein